MDTITLHLEQIAGDWFAWMDAHTGAFSQGSTAQAAVQHAQTAYIDHMNWLQAHGEIVPDTLRQLNVSALRTEIAETLPSDAMRDRPERGAFFTYDILPMEDEELNRYLQILAYAHTDLRHIANDLPLEKWDGALPGGGPSIRSLVTMLVNETRMMLLLTQNLRNEGGQSVSALLAHVLETERALFEHQGVTQQMLESNNPVIRLYSLEALYQVFLEAIQTVSADKRNAVITLDNDRWTLRRILRYVFWGERHCAMQIATRSRDPLLSPDFVGMEDYFDSLSYAMFEPNYYLFWTQVILDLMHTIGSDTDLYLNRLVGILLAYYEQEEYSDESIESICRDIVRLRGVGFWEDNSILGRKYRCLNAIASTRLERAKDSDNWQYSVQTALQAINYGNQNDALIVRKIKEAIKVYPM